MDNSSATTSSSWFNIKQILQSYLGIPQPQLQQEGNINVLLWKSSPKLSTDNSKEEERKTSFTTTHLDPVVIVISGRDASESAKQWRQRRQQWQKRLDNKDNKGRRGETTTTTTMTTTTRYQEARKKQGQQEGGHQDRDDNDDESEGRD